MKSLKVTIKQKHVVKGRKDDESYDSKFDNSMIDDDIDDFGIRIEPGSHKKNPEVVDDDDDETEKADDEKMNDDEKKNETGAIHRMCMRQGYMIQHMEKKYVTVSNLKPVVAETIIQEHDAFQVEVLALVLKEFAYHAPRIIEELFKSYVSNNIIQVHPTTNQTNDPELWDVLKHTFEKSSTSNTSCRDDDFHSQYHDDHQEDDAPPEGEKRVKRHKTFKSSNSVRGSLSKRSAKESTYYVSKQQQQQQQEWDTWDKETIIDEDEVILKDETPELII
ncbi:hypothetical protein Tco_0725343 [Tanacetum coccineum]|uniref:Uncharacterized protein n=1 Tax=Tanacetum coccineum TaxID=301880 RepID=A0ABQ4YF32_9ASTR